MNRLVAAVAIALGLLAWHGIAYASCTSHTYSDASGRMVFCTTCCYYGHCTTTCTQ